jgi:hypothetical protein
VIALLATQDASENTWQDYFYHVYQLRGRHSSRKSILSELIRVKGGRIIQSKKLTIEEVKLGCIILLLWYNNNKLLLICFETTQIVYWYYRLLVTGKEFKEAGKDTFAYADGSSQYNVNCIEVFWIPNSIRSIFFFPYKYYLYLNPLPIVVFLGSHMRTPLCCTLGGFTDTYSPSAFASHDVRVNNFSRTWMRPRGGGGGGVSGIHPLAIVVKRHLLFVRWSSSIK